jgi:hypothetical protein
MSAMFKIGQNLRRLFCTHYGHQAGKWVQVGASLHRVSNVDYVSISILASVRRKWK